MRAVPPAGLPERQTIVEQRLFDTHVLLDLRRAELDVVATRLRDASEEATTARRRLGTAETAHAGRALDAARRRVRELERERDAAALEVERLVGAQDALLAKLVG